jgi:endonuclease III
MARTDIYREMASESDRMHELMFKGQNNPREFERFVELYIAKQRALGSSGSYASAHLALDSWLRRGYSMEAAIRRVRARSSLNTLQEQQVGLPNEEWRILVACVLLNQTHGRQVRPMITQLFARAPGPVQLLAWIEQEGDGQLRELIKPLGLSHRRSKTIISMSGSMILLNLPPQDVSCGSWAEVLAGIGPYAVDSLDIFRYGKLRTTCTDTWLNDYVKWRIEHENL